MGEGKLNVLPVDLKLPPAPPPPEVPYRGVKELPHWDESMGPPDPQIPQDYAQAYQWFHRASLRIKPEVCMALAATRGMCLDLLQERVFETAFGSPMRLQEFIEKEEAAVMRLKGRLGMWVNTIRSRITQALQTATVKWFNTNETSL